MLEKLTLKSFSLEQVQSQPLNELQMSNNKWFNVLVIISLSPTVQWRIIQSV